MNDHPDNNSPTKPKRPCHICGGVDGEHVYEMHREGFAATAANPSSKEAGPALKPCPFCGASATLQLHDDLKGMARIVCRAAKCKLWPSTPWYTSIQEVAVLWNTRVSADSAGAMVDAVKVAERIVIYLAGKYIDPSAGSMEVQPIADIIAAAVPRNEAAVDADRLWEVLRAECCKSDKAELIVFLSRKKFNKALARLSSDNS